MTEGRMAEVRDYLAEESRKRNLVHYFAWWPDGFWWTLPVSAEFLRDSFAADYILGVIVKDLVERDRDLLDAEDVVEIRPEQGSHAHHY